MRRTTPVACCPGASTGATEVYTTVGAPTVTPAGAAIAYDTAGSLYVWDTTTSTWTLVPSGTSKPWYTANLGPLTAGATTVTHSLGLTNPDEVVVQLWDNGGVEPLVTNVESRTANTLDVLLELPSNGDVVVVVGRSNLN